MEITPDLVLFAIRQPTALLSLIPLVQTLLPIFAIAWTQPRRPRFWLRGTVIAVAVCAVTIVLTPFFYALIISSDSRLASDVYSFASSVMLLVFTVPALLVLFETSVWKAAFCVSAGYTIQNIGSGLSETVTLLARRVAGIPLSATMRTSIANPELPEATAVVFVISMAVFLAVFALAYLLFIRRIHMRGLAEVEDHKMMAVLLLVILAVIAFDVVNKSLDDQGVGLGTLMVLRCVHGAVCLFVLFVQYEMLYSKALEVELAVGRQMAAERERQYELSRQNIDAINVKCHDIRHQIRQLADGATAVDQEFLADVEREVAVYDSLVKTGNEALDTILSEKGLVCEREGISLSCIADGEALDFMAPAEIYSLFGNALDNAIRAVGALGPDDDRRSISLVVRRVGALVTVHVENGFVGTVEFEDGLPRSTQEGPDHGFGGRSMRTIVERHGGTLTLGTRGNVFTVNAMIPVP